MKRFLVLLLAFAGGFAALALFHRGNGSAVPDAPAVAQKIREVAKLEALEVMLYKKVSFEPEPTAQASAWDEVTQWVRFSIRPPQGRAIVFAKAHLSYDLSALDGAQLKLDRDHAALTLPKLQCQIELLPAETEIIRSTLDSTQTAALLEKARVAFERETLADPTLRARAEASARATLRALLFQFGYRQVSVNPS